MSIEDLTKAFWMLNADPLAWNLTVRSIKDGKIFFTSGKDVDVKDLVALYNEEYGE